jgi:hypothetical protein
MNPLCEDDGFETYIVPDVVMIRAIFAVLLRARLAEAVALSLLCSMYTHS